MIGSLALTTGGNPVTAGMTSSSTDSTAYWNDAQRAGGTGTDQGRSVAVAPDGTVLVTGDFEETAYFPTSAEDSIALTSSGGSDVFVAALNADDTYFAWAQRAGGASSDLGNSVAVAADGTVLTTGYFGGTAYFPTSAEDSIALTSLGGTDVFVAALNEDDSYFAWAQSAGSAPCCGGQGNDAAYSVAVAADGTVLVTGYIRGTAYFPTSADDSIALTAVGNTNLFVAALNADDSYFAWAQQAVGIQPSTTKPEIQGNSVAVAPDGTILITGSIKVMASFPTSADDSITLTSDRNNNDVFVAAMNADDSYFAWAQRAGGINADSGNSVAVAPDGTVLVIGSFQNTAYFPTSADDSIALTAVGNSHLFVAALNADDSYFTWAQQVGSPDGVAGNSVAVAADGTVVVAGDFENTAYFPTSADDSIALTAPEFSSNAFVAALRMDDSYFAWAQRAGPGGGDYAAGRSVAVAADGTVVVTGDFDGTASFPTGADDSIVLDSAGNLDVFVGWGMSLPIPPVPPAPPGPALPAGAVTDVSGVAGDGRVTVSWTPPASSGSFPITTYQATATPGGRSCLVTAPTVDCDVSGLANGTPYTFTVRALTGAGWSPWSQDSPPVVPQKSDPESLIITGARGEVRGTSGVIVAGTSTGLDPGAILRPMVKLAGQTSYTEGSASILVDQDGAFTWQRRTGKKMYAFVVTQDGTTRSNRVIIPARGPRPGSDP